jgi:hypothetical protein
MASRTLNKLLRTQLLKQNPQALPTLVVELQDAVEHAIEIAKGDKGETGYSPIKGKDYFDGRDGYTPRKNVDYSDGRDGKNGEDGKDGCDGLDGQDGKDATFDQQPFFDELKKLKKELEEKDLTIDEVFKAIEERKIDAKNIRGLPNQVIIPAKGKKKIDFSDMRWHGGGGDISNSGIYTQAPVGAIDGVNQTYTVSNTIHSVFSMAINGMYLSLNADYTVSGTTITMVTALDASLSGTTFSITYA